MPSWDGQPAPGYHAALTYLEPDYHPGMVIYTLGVTLELHGGSCTILECLGNPWEPSQNERQEFKCHLRTATQILRLHDDPGPHRGHSAAATTAGPWGQSALGGGVCQTLKHIHFLLACLSGMPQRDSRREMRCFWQGSVYRKRHSRRVETWPAGVGGPLLCLGERAEGRGPGSSCFRGGRHANSWWHAGAPCSHLLFPIAAPPRMYPPRS